MILAELVGGENDPRYQALEVENGKRHYDFLRSVVTTSMAVGRPVISSNAIKALNFHAIACLHVSAGEYRPCAVTVGQAPDQYVPPPDYLVPSLMDDMINVVNRNWDATPSLALGAFVLWRMNAIHPFINGNGRTARAACYLVICLKEGKWFPGTHILPELIKRERPRYVAALKAVDRSMPHMNLQPLVDVLGPLMQEQLASARPDSPYGPDRKWLKPSTRRWKASDQQR